MEPEPLEMEAQANVLKVSKRRPRVILRPSYREGRRVVLCSDNGLFLPGEHEAMPADFLNSSD